MTDHGTRCGTVAVAGPPNAGKSSLVNAIVGQALAIVSPKPQTTRKPVVGIRTDGNVQLIFQDLPGLLTPRYALQEAMLDEALAVLRRADAVLYLSPASDPPPPPIASWLPDDVRLAAPVATVLSKADEVDPARLGDPPPPTFVVSAVGGQGIEPLLAWCRDLAPPGPFRHGADDLSSQPLRFFVAEYVREMAFTLLSDELPYAVAAEVDEFREQSEPVYIRVYVYVERASQKGMVIGEGGRTIKAIGRGARERIEHLLGSRVYLDLWVKVLPQWRKSAQALRGLGFEHATRNR